MRTVLDYAALIVPFTNIHVHNHVYYALCQIENKLHGRDMVIVLFNCNYSWLPFFSNDNGIINLGIMVIDHNTDLYMYYTEIHVHVCDFLHVTYYHDYDYTQSVIDCN